MAHGLHRTAPLLALAALTACVEIDPAYADSYATTVADPTDATTSADPPATDTDPDPDPSTSSGPSACECSAFELCEANACTQPARILFINLDGVTATFGAPDASQDSQGLYPELAGTWSGYGADATTRQTLLSSIAAQWEPYRVIVTDQRPPAGSAPYMQAVVTADPPPEMFGGVAWIAFPDCGDTIPQDMLFVFAAPGDGFGVAAHATYVGGALARAFGLQFTNAPDDLTGNGDRFVQTCYPRTESPACTAHHPELCDGDANQQSSHLELELLLGTRG